MTVALVDRVHVLVRALRARGVDVSTGEVIDAIEALSHLDLSDRASVHAGLRSALAKDVLAAERFDSLFIRIFRAGSSTSDHEAPEPAPTHAPASAAAGATPSGVSKDVLDALRSGDADQLRTLAAQAVESFAGIDGAADGTTERYFLHRVMRAIDISRMLSAAMQQLRREGDLSEFDIGLQRNEFTRLLEEFRRTVASEIARRMSPFDDIDIVGVTDPADREIVELSPQELAELRHVVQPLARQLAARIGRRRKLRPTGRLDTRRTVRRSLQSGGAPIEVISRRKHPHKPDVVLLCDVSGSVAEFAQFTFSLVNAVHRELRGVRSFAFVDGVAEVTDLFQHAAYEIHVARFVERRGVIRLDGHSDYGRVFEHFNHRYLDEAVSSRTTVIISGDGRGNYREPRSHEFARLTAKARRVFWLNPEPSAAWGRDDSLIELYRPYCNGVHEVRTLRQLSDVIAQLV